ncbi:hypothetical protein DFH08DRAFT_827326 [Mycena albidolilacea]|uniref:Uncharacterized protein n=1 Tax=Mycena albidolilacea TaxID=1033008 RepID=A0AAD7E7A8_9AGAR|nr:hypothetical protein DFH08DRAFT_827326 [Mycena albidolilacea]
MPTAPRVPSGAKKVPKGLRASKAVKKAPKDLEQLPAPMVAALKLINDLKKKNHLTAPPTGSSKATCGRFGTASISHGLRTAAPVRSGARPVLALPVAEKNSYEINFATEIAHINTEIDRLGHHADDAGPVLCRLDCLSKATTKVFKAEFLSNDFHANFLMVVHAPNGVNPSPGKALVVGDPNVINTVEGIPNRRMGALVNHARRKLKGSPVFLNRVRPVRNSNGECLQLVLRWILDLILHADEFLKDVKRCSGGKVSSLKGFRNLGMK